MSDWKECRNYENCGCYCIYPDEFEAGLCGNCLEERVEDERAAELERLRAELSRVTAQRDAILMQARIWSGEAKAQKATVDAVGEILGGVPDWGPIAQGVEQLRAELAASREREARMRAVLETWVKAADGDGNPVTTIIDFDKLVRAALAEGAQG